MTLKLRPTLNWLQVFVPVALALRFVPGLRNDALLFIAACLAVIPLAGWMGRATEHLAEHTGEGVGGLLNATFGNAAELIIGLMALNRGLYGVVKASITGSIIGNILLVLGLSLFAGGLKFSEQKFNRTAARVSATTLSFAAIALIIPTVFHQAAQSRPGGWSQPTQQKLSLAIAVVLFLTYGCTLLFSLKTHRTLYSGGSSDDNHEEVWSMRKAMVILAIATALVAAMSELLVSTVEAAEHSMGLTEVFVGVIIVAIIGNAAEHSTAVMMAMKNKMDLSVNVAIGSSTQIALVVAPLLVFASYLLGKPMDLEFTLPEVFAIVVAIFIAGQICSDGESNWLEGVQLLSVYLILGILFYFLPEAASSPAGLLPAHGGGGP